MRKRFLIAWLEAFGYVPKRRELLGITGMLVCVASVLWWVSESVWLVVGCVVMVLVATYTLTRFYLLPWDEWDADQQEERIKNERKRIEETYGA